MNPDPSLSNAASISNLPSADQTPAGRDTDPPASTPGERPWWPYVLPLAVFMLVGSLEPTPVAPNGDGADAAGILWTGLRIEYRYYPIVYSLKIALTLASMAAAWTMYRSFRWRLTPWAAPVGVLGAGVWIGLCRLRLEPAVFHFVGLDSWAELGQRSGFNPLVEMSAQPLLAYAFLAIRFAGLALLVPVIEEFFLRGLLARAIVHPDWWTVPFGQVNAAALAVLTVYPALTHPGEAIAAVVWFSGITWLMVRTRNIWDCVVAHAVTNLLLGVYVVANGDWRLM